MRTIRKFLVSLLACVGLAFAAQGCMPLEVGAALTADPVVTVVAPTSVVVGTPITFTLTIDQAGYAPTNGTQKVAWFNPRTFATLNVANYTVIPETYSADVWTFTYVPGAAEVGRVETFSVKVPVSAARIPRTVLGYASFQVVAPAV